VLAQEPGSTAIPRPGSAPAHLAAGSRRSVNAALRGFERRGWIAVQDRAVTVSNVEALGRFAGN
jgi:hypothetical protein